MAEHKNFIDIYIWRCLASAMLFCVIAFAHAHAAQECNLALKIAINEEIRSACEKN